jgi:hypothetical protein
MWLLGTLLLAVPCGAGPDLLAEAGAEPPSVVLADARPPVPASAQTSEYNRLSEELETLVQKSAWVGVERTFHQLLATGVPLSFDDWVRGAESAKAVGDAAATRQRLVSANALREDRRVLEWLWDLDQRFGPVKLLCDADSYFQLQPAVLVLDPDVRRAIEHAQVQVHDTCRFEGMLPIGSYTLHDETFEVAPGRPLLTVDLRGVPMDRQTRRKLKETWLQP